VLLMIKKPIARQQLLEMIYMSKAGKISKRTIKPFKVKDDSFTAYCFLRQARRTFKIDCVLSVVPVTSKKITLES